MQEYHMSGTADYKIHYDAIDELSRKLSDKKSQWEGQLQELVNTQAEFISMTSFRGVTADSIKAYLTEVHGLIVQSIFQAIEENSAEFLLYQTDYFALDGGVSAVMPQQSIMDLKNYLSSSPQYISVIDESIRTELNKVSDLVYVYAPSSSALVSKIQETAQDVERFDADIAAYESTKIQSAQNARNLVAQLQMTLNDLLSGKINISQYKPGGFASLTSMLNLSTAGVKSQSNLIANQEKIALAEQSQLEMRAQVRENLVEASEERVWDGFWKLATGAVQGAVTATLGVMTVAAAVTAATVLAPAAAVAMTAGAAVVAVATVGVALYATSEVAEGAQDIYYGSKADIKTKAKNPLRDTLFAGNQAAYDTAGGICSTIAGGAAGKAVSAGKLLVTSAFSFFGGLAKDATVDYIQDSVLETSNLNREDKELVENITDGAVDGIEFGMDILG